MQSRSRIEEIIGFLQFSKSMKTCKEHILRIRFILPRFILNALHSIYSFISLTIPLYLHILHHRCRYASARIQMQHTILRSISVMNIQIHDRNPSEPRVHRSCIRRSDRHIVQQTKSLRNRRIVRVFHRSRRSNVMTRRSNHTKNVPNFGIRERRLIKFVDCRTDRLCSATRLEEALAADRGVDVERDEPVFLLHELKIRKKPSIFGIR